MNATILISFLGFTSFVILYTFLKTRHSNRDTKDGYFLGGRSLMGLYIASSLLLTNLSAASFVGMTAQAYSGNMSVMGWEVMSGFTMVLVALFLVPRYLKQGITTIPDFLESRYSLSVKKIVTFLFLFQYIFNLLPITLYAGARVLIGIFDIQDILGITEFQAIALISCAICFLGFFYSIFGGLKTIVTADSVNSIGLLIGGILIPIFGFLTLGRGDFLSGVNQILTVAPEKLQAIGKSGDPLPFSTLFTGLLLVNLYYWGTDQAIMQRVLGAKNLKEGQKGIFGAAIIKVFTPLFLILPGIIAFHIFGPEACNPDSVYTKLVKEVLPKPLIGFFLAVMFGAILSTFNGILNSSTTLFTLNVYKPIFGKNKTDKQIVKEGKLIAILIAIISVIIAPFIIYAPAGLFDLLQRISGFSSVPIFTIVFVGYISKRVPKSAAIVALILFISSYATMQLFIHPDIHFLNQLAILFVICTVLMLIIGKIWPRKIPYIMPINKNINIKPWQYRFVASAVIIYCVIGIFLLFSNLGFVEMGTTQNLILKIYISIGIILLIMAFSLHLKRNINRFKTD